ncbi:MAG: hypothetical protein WCI76_00650 [bacterium]
MLKNNLSFNLPVIITKQNKRFVAFTPALDLSTSGKSEKQARERFVELANIFFEEIFEVKTADDILFELGWKKVQKKWNPPEIISSQYMGLQIPVFA